MKNTIKLLPHQSKILDETKHFSNVAYYLDMGTGKTFLGSEKVRQINNKYTLVICQKSKMKDWYDHFKTYYPNFNTIIYKSQQIKEIPYNSIIIINYDSVWRKEELLELNNFYFTMMLDESQHIKNESAKRTKFITKKLLPQNTILLSGTPTGGKYEELYSQIKLLGWTITKSKFYDDYIITKLIDIGQPWNLEVVTGYRNVKRLKENLKKYGAIFLKSEEVMELPEQNDIKIKIPVSKEYKRFEKDGIVSIDGNLVVGDTKMTELIRLRQLAGTYNTKKYEYLKDLLESTNDRIIIFYNFKEEYDNLFNLCSKLKKSVSTVNGQKHDLNNYDTKDDSITLVQYQAGATGQNFQKSNKVIYFSATVTNELYIQSKKRIHRHGQTRPCFYYYLITGIESKIYESLENGKNYNDRLFEKEVQR